MTDALPSSLTPVFFGSVNRWECDENDHLNVRFFAQKIQQTLQFGLIEAGLATPDNVLSVCRCIKNKHMRFIAEARMAVPIVGADLKRTFCGAAGIYHKGVYPRTVFW